MDWKKPAALAFLLFVTLWAVGIVRSFFLEEPDVPAVGIPTLIALREYQARMSSWNNLAQLGIKQTPLPQLLDQDINQLRIYDKTAQVASGSTEFASDEGRVRAAIAGQKGVVFDEKATGVAPERSLVLGISVRPEQFDELLRQLSAIGQVSSLTVEQEDRTSEFRKLHAQRQSLKKHQEAILKLRDKALSVEESLKLELKIVDIEKELQSLGVQLGDFLAREPAYNLFLTLREQRSVSTFTIEKRLWSGLWWAAGWWSLGVLGLGAVLGTTWSIRTLRSPVPAAPAPA
jgi:hypothetical protein